MADVYKRQRVPCGCFDLGNAVLRPECEFLPLGCTDKITTWDETSGKFAVAYDLSLIHI